MDRLKGKKVVIAGAGQTPGEDVGNGRAIAIRFATEGAELVLAARHIERAEETANKIFEAVPNAKVFCFQADCTDEEQVKALFEFAKEKLGSVDILVNNIGIMLQSDNRLMTMTEKDYTKMTDTNMKTAIYLNRCVKDYMPETGGAIVQTSSIAGVLPGGNLYTLTKAGMIKIGEMFAKMYAPLGIRVNTIILGFVKTAMGVEFHLERSGKSREEINRSRDNQVPLRGGQGTAWDTANAALFLASDEAKFITGANLPVDGGGSIGYM